MVDGKAVARAAQPAGERMHLLIVCRGTPSTLARAFDYDTYVAWGYRPLKRVGFLSLGGEILNWQ